LRPSGKQYASTSSPSQRQRAAALALLIAAGCAVVVALASTRLDWPFAQLALPAAAVAYALAVGRLIWMSLAENAAARRTRHAEADGVGVVDALAEELSQPLCAISANADAISRLLDREQADLAEVRAAVADIVGDVDRISKTLRQAQRLADSPTANS
jgi:hypothetical protein